VIRSTTVLLFCVFLAGAQDGAKDQGEKDRKVEYSKQEQLLVAKVQGFSITPYEMREKTAKPLALEIRHLPPSLNKLRLADALAVASMGGDAGHEGWQEIATTLAGALREQPGKLESGYTNLAQLMRYKHVDVSLDDPLLAEAIAKLADDDRRREQVDFTLTDLSGKKWTLKELKGRVVLVNFFLTASRPCWQEVAELQNLSQHFKKTDLVILAISGEDRERVANFAKSLKITYPVLLDEGQKVAQQYRIAGAPKTFVYNRDGKLVAQALDMQTRKQLYGMLKEAGLE
jgi:peroxiredoxin